jgi:hypothetical protein
MIPTIRITRYWTYFNSAARGCALFSLAATYLLFRGEEVKLSDIAESRK